MDHLMNDVASRRDIRAWQKEATRARIVAAVSDLVAHDHPAAISVPAVAERAGVGVATVYRYFPSKEELLDAAATAPVSAASARLPESFAEVGPSLKAAWGELAEQLPLVRGQFASPVGRELHHRRWQVRDAVMQAYLAEDGVDPASPDGRRMLGMADVLTSSTALLELHDKAGVPVDDAADWCSWAIGVLLSATKDDATKDDGTEDDATEGER
jgi:AcrR family transcriptional regulator